MNMLALLGIEDFFISLFYFHKKRHLRYLSSSVYFAHLGEVTITVIFIALPFCAFDKYSNTLMQED